MQVRKIARYFNKRMIDNREGKTKDSPTDGWTVSIGLYWTTQLEHKAGIEPTRLALIRPLRKNCSYRWRFLRTGPATIHHGSHRIYTDPHHCARYCGLSIRLVLQNGSLITTRSITRSITRSTNYRQTETAKHDVVASKFQRCLYNPVNIPRTATRKHYQTYLRDTRTRTHMNQPH